MMNAESTKYRISTNILCKYPFLDASKARVTERDIAPVDALYTYPGIIDKVRTVFSDALDGKERTSALGHDSEESMFLYPWLRIILLHLNMPRVTFKVANLVSKHYGTLLATEDEGTLVRIASDQGFTVQQAREREVMMLGTVPHPFTIPFVDYLKVAVAFKAAPWKLVNRPVDKGLVYLRKHDLARMVEEVLKVKINEIHRAQARDALDGTITSDPMVAGLMEQLRTMSSEKLVASAGNFDGLPVDDSSFPPCINGILDKNAKGINLTHVERLFLVYFLLTIGKPVEEVLDLFRIQPDFNEKIARYQVEFAAGKRGKGTAYKPHNCATLESLNICMKADPRFTSKQCTEPKFPFKNPLTCYRRLVKYKEWMATRDAAATGNAPAPGAGEGK